MYVTLPNELAVQKFSKVLMDLDCLSQNVLISRFDDYQKSANICVFFSNIIISLFANIDQFLVVFEM